MHYLFHHAFTFFVILVKTGRISILFSKNSVTSSVFLCMHLCVKLMLHASQSVSGLIKSGNTGVSVYVGVCVCVCVCVGGLTRVCMCVFVSVCSHLVS